ncbi:hypothetical protein F5Y08DRAFT_319869 [Xylaria arbuscula]|nr:hypothetical protein F5Y08DRAFT_319869 [Xylaria arbuscula]
MRHAPPLSCVPPGSSSPIQRQCLLSFLYPSQALLTTHHHSPRPFSKIASASASTALPQRRRRNDLPKTTKNIRRQPFHSTAPRRDAAIDNARDYYETLKVAPTATPAEIKKSFYTLSKTHHPDLHAATDRRIAAKRFMRISEAYSILSSPTKRAKYDREHMAHHSPSSSSSHLHPTRQGSYSSTGPAGGRPASGLSKRRGTFTGPPPSFFRSGGWGSQGEKRRAAHEESTGGAGSSSGSSSTSSFGSGSGSGSTGTGSGSTMGGMGPGQDPFGHRDDVPHFDKEGHQRTGRHNDRRREARRASSAGGSHREGAVIEPERGVAGMFFVIGGVVLISFLGPYLISRIWYASARQPKEKKSG